MDSPPLKKEKEENEMENTNEVLTQEIIGNTFSMTAINVEDRPIIKKIIVKNCYIKMQPGAKMCFPFRQWPPLIGDTLILRDLAIIPLSDAKYQIWAYNFINKVYVFIQKIKRQTYMLFKTTLRR